jgi:mRNA interferase MazF
MKRGDLYRIHKPAGDPKQFRVFAVVSRQTLIDSRFSTVVCARVYTSGQGLATQVPVGIDEGLKHSSWIMCDDFASIRKSDLTQFVGSLSQTKISELDKALAIAVGIR